MDKWIEVHKARTAEVLKALAHYIRQRCGEGDVVLFGFRARGTHHALSDWDIAVITPQGQYAVEATEFGNGDYWTEYKKAATKYVKERRLARTPTGWYPAT